MPRPIGGPAQPPPIRLLTKRGVAESDGRFWREISPLNTFIFLYRFHVVSLSTVDAALVISPHRDLLAKSGNFRATYVRTTQKELRAGINCCLFRGFFLYLCHNVPPYLFVVYLGTLTGIAITALGF